MKSIAALGAGMAIAAAAALWFTTRPVVVTTEIRPLAVNSNLQGFKPVPSKFEGR